MKKMLMLMVILSSLSYAFTDENNGFSNSNTTNPGSSTPSISALERNANLMEEAYKNTLNKDKEIEGARAGISNIASFDVWKSIDDFFDKVDSGFDTGFRVIDAAGTIASTGLAIVGSIPTVFGTGAPGAAAAANTIQSMLQKFNQIKQRVDSLKEFKRQIERFKNLDPKTLKTLDGINSLLGDVTNLVNETTNIKSQLIDSYKGFNANLKTSEGWNEVLKDSEKISKLNREINDNIAGNNNKKVIKMINDFKKKINGMDSSTQLQSLQKLNANMSLLIAIIEKQLQNDALNATRAIAIEDKALQGQIAQQEAKKKNIEALNQNINQLKKKIKSDALGTRFVGDVTGGK